MFYQMYDQHEIILIVTNKFANHFGLNNSFSFSFCVVDTLMLAVALIVQLFGLEHVLCRIELYYTHTHAHTHTPSSIRQSDLFFNQEKCVCVCVYVFNRYICIK